MLSRRLFLTSAQLQTRSAYLLARPLPQRRLLSSSIPLHAAQISKNAKKNKDDAKPDAPVRRARKSRKTSSGKTLTRRVKSQKTPKSDPPLPKVLVDQKAPREEEEETSKKKSTLAGKSLKEALLGPSSDLDGLEAMKLDIKTLQAKDLDFKPVDVPVPSVPMLSYGLDRVLFNPGIYRLQDPRSRIYNFDPYLEKIMQVAEFDFKALTPYKTSSKDEELLELTDRLGVKYTGSTSSMSGVLQHFHFLLSNFRYLNHDMLSRSFPPTSLKFSKITLGPSAVFLRWKNGVYAIDADKAYDSPNIMSWLGHSMEKLLTTSKEEFERYRKSSPSKAPPEEENRCFHYSTQGNFLMRSQLDAHDPRLPGSGMFDLKTRAVVSIRMNHEEYESGAGYQLRFDRGEWESFEREFYDMTRSTMLKYSLQVRMGRMDGIFVAYHNIERIFGFQYLGLSDLDNVLHGQTDSCLGDQEFKFSIRLLDEMLEKATAQYPEQTLRLHFHTAGGRSPFMYFFAEPVTDEQADEIQSRSEKANKIFERDVVGIEHSEEELQEEWNQIQGEVDENLESAVEEVENASETGEKRDDDEHGTGEVEEADSLQVDEPQSEQTSELQEDGEVEEASELQEESEDSDATLVNDAETPMPASRGPLMGWTLVTRSCVDGHYVDRPTKLEPDMDWSLEYHIKEIPEEKVWKLYEKVQKTRNKLIGDLRNENTGSLDTYRKMIRKYTNRGRKWREEQDVIDDQLGVRVYESMGPGSPSFEKKE